MRLHLYNRSSSPGYGNAIDYELNKNAGYQLPDCNPYPVPNGGKKKNSRGITPGPGQNFFRAQMASPRPAIITATTTTPAAIGAFVVGRAVGRGFKVA